MDLRVRPGTIGTDSEVHPTKLFLAKSLLAHIVQPVVPFLNALLLCRIIILQPRSHVAGIGLPERLRQLNRPMQGGGA